MMFRIKLNRSYMLLPLLGLLLFSCTHNALVITDRGRSTYKIVPEDQNDEVLNVSAEILQRYLEKIGSVKIPIDYDHADDTEKFILKIDESLNKNEIDIRVEDNDVIIKGGSSIAVRNGVYEFLENYLGCRWFSPQVEKVPSRHRIDLPYDLHYNYEPEIAVRTVHSRLFYDDHEYADKLKVTYEAFPYYVPRAGVHTFHRFLPEEKFYEQHPEYYALRNGHRLPTQLCLTNPEVLQIVKDSVRSMFERHPEATVISVSQDDNTQFCECDNCSLIDEEEGSHAGTMIRFVNEVAAEFPDKTISTLAYQHTRKPCKTRPVKNVMITLCSIECDRSGPIEEKCAGFADDLKGWHRLTSNIRIWDYTTQFTNFLAPFPNIFTLKPNIELFAGNGVKWVFEQHSNNPSELFELRSYLTARLLWNPEADAEEIMDEFLSGYYENAGEFIGKYIKDIHHKISLDKDFFLFLYGDPSQAFSSWLDPDALKEYSSLFDKAEKAVADKPAVLKRVMEARLGIDFAVLEACRKGISEEYSLTVMPKSGDERKVNPEVTELLDRFRSVCKNADITLLNEMGYTVDEYYDSFKNSIKVAGQPNLASGKEVKLFTKPKKYANEDPQVLTDGALGGNSFYANWLGFEGNDMEARVDLGTTLEIKHVSMAFLQVTNHIVFFPKEVTYYYSADDKEYIKWGSVVNDHPLNRNSKINDIKYFELNTKPVQARYIKVMAENLKAAPYWHHAAGLPSWIFSDEIIIN